MELEKWVNCPVCSGKTRVKIREDMFSFRYPPPD